jgi:sulfate permease, SulP family
MAYAALAGVDVTAGLYALLLPVIAYVFLGSYRRLVVGPESAVAILVASAIAPLAHGDAARYAALVFGLAIAIGCVFLLAWVLRLGWIADYFSQPVLIGYLSGIGLALIIGQLSSWFAISYKNDSAVRRVGELFGAVDNASSTTLLVGVVSFLFLLACTIWIPKLPSALIVVVVGIAASWIFDWSAHGIATVGTVPSGFPGFAIPDLSVDDVRSLIGPALAIFVVAFAESMLTARSFAMQHGESIRADNELLALGVANISAGFTQAIPVSTSSSRTAVNDGLATSQVAGLVATGIIGVILLFFTHPIQYLPDAVLAAVIINAAIKLIRPKAWRALAKSSKAEVLIALVALVVVLSIGVIQALGVAVALSLLDVIRRSAAPHDALLGYSPTLQRWADVTDADDAEILPHIVVYRLGERLFFANAHFVKRRMWAVVNGAPPPVRWLIFDASATNDIDSTAQAALHEVVVGLAAQGTGFAVARAPSALMDRLLDVGLVDDIGPENFYSTVGLAVADCSRRAPHLTISATSPSRQGATKNPSATS